MRGYRILLKGYEYVILKRVKKNLVHSSGNEVFRAFNARISFSDFANFRFLVNKGNMYL